MLTPRMLAMGIEGPPIRSRVALERGDTLRLLRNPVNSRSDTEGQERGTFMRTIDIHAPLMRQCFGRAVDAGKDWYGTRHEAGEGLGATVTDGKRMRVPSAKLRSTPEERLKDMDEQGVDVHVVSIHTPLFSYHLDAAKGRQLARDVNDEIAGMTRQWPQRFAGLATLPVQDVGAAIHELERAA